MVSAGSAAHTSTFGQEPGLLLGAVTQAQYTGSLGAGPHGLDNPQHLT